MQYFKKDILKSKFETNATKKIGRRRNYPVPRSYSPLGNQQERNISDLGDYFYLCLTKEDKMSNWMRIWFHWIYESRFFGLRGKKHSPHWLIQEENKCIVLRIECQEASLISGMAERGAEGLAKTGKVHTGNCSRIPHASPNPHNDDAHFTVRKQRGRDQWSWGT